MIVNKTVTLVWAALLAAGSMGGCECGRDVLVEDGVQLEHEKIIDKAPQAPRPDVVFPRGTLTGEPSLNKFIERALSVCADGDYDGFRRLFGTAYRPPDQADFEERWHGVQGIEIRSVDLGKEDPPEYYVHALIRLREPDRKGRRKLDAVVRVFREGEAWRLGEAPKEVVERILVAATRPADNGPAGRRSP